MIRWDVPQRRPLCAPALGLLLLVFTINLGASEIVDLNPFDPGRKPWKQEKEPAPSLPELTPKDLQIDAIISFGQFRGIIAQLDGRLKGVLPANAAGKVRIQVGQNFGGGYVLSGLGPNQVVIQGGEKRFIIPLLRKVSKGGVPAPAVQAQEQPATIPSSQPASTPMAVESPVAPLSAVPAPTSGNPPASLAAPVANPFAGQSLSPMPGLPVDAPPPVDASAPPNAAPSDQPMSLLDAIKKAQEAAKSRTNNPAPPAGIPFMGKQ